jgi:phosphoglycerol transferase MdoB-like AlkP superfamily enzyme
MENTKWHKFISELANIIFFWLFSIIFFFIFRLFFIFFFRNELSEAVAFSDFTKSLFMGFRFDTQIVTYFILIPLILNPTLLAFNVFKARKIIRLIFQACFIILATFICLITINYYKEYNEQFNHFLFLGLYDDQKMVFETIMADFHPYLNLIIFIVIIVISFLIFKYFENKKRIANFLLQFKSKSFKIALVSISLILLAGSIRGSFSSRPVIRKWAYLTKDSFLNKTIINPFKSLKYAIGDFNKINQSGKKNPFGQVENESKIVSNLIKKESKGAHIEKPKQIFIVVMESFDSWPLQDEYEDFNVANNLKNIANKGIHFTHFLPSAASTMNSLGAILTGVPYSGVNISRIGAVNGPYKSALFNQFEKLGYETNMFVGCFLSWQNIGNFSKNQGVNTMYSSPDAESDKDSGFYGIDDEGLFNMTLKKIDTSKYTLNVILTSSYHPPFKVDIYKKGFHLKTIADLPKQSQEQFTGSMSFDALGHLWYSDKAIGDFVKKAEEKFPNAIFCFTGDHFGRRFINSKPNLYEKSAVPFIIYGKNIEPKKITTAGSHIDIFPTLIEMIAPKDFTYYSFGESLFNSDKTIGIGYNKVINDKTLQHITKSGIVNTYNITC